MGLRKSLPRLAFNLNAEENLHQSAKAPATTPEEVSAVAEGATGCAAGAARLLRLDQRGSQFSHHIGQTGSEKEEQWHVFILLTKIGARGRGLFPVKL